MNNPSHYQLRDLDKAINADVRKKSAKNGGTPPWLKDYAGQLYDPEYASLTLAERGLLKDLRLLALARDNKIPNDERYLCEQLRCNLRTRLAPKLCTLRAKGFLLVHPEAWEKTDEQAEESRATLELVAPQVTLEERREEEKEPLHVEDVGEWTAILADDRTQDFTDELEEFRKRKTG